MLSIFEIMVLLICFIIMILIGIGGLVCLICSPPNGISTIELDEWARWQMEQEGFSEEEIIEYLYGKEINSTKET